MFLVQDEYGIFTVYAVRDNSGTIEFLLYDTHGWGWSEANHYKPFTSESE